MMTPNMCIQVLPSMLEEAMTGPCATRAFMRRYVSDDAGYVWVLVHEPSWKGWG